MDVPYLRNEALDSCPNAFRPITTSVTEAMHWQRGLHLVSTNLFEVNIPIPATADGSPNWQIVKQSWMAMTDVRAQFNKAGKYPSDLGLESRLMAGSDLLMAPQHGNRWTQSIEVSASPLVPRDIWEEFKVYFFSHATMGDTLLKSHSKIS